MQHQKSVVPFFEYNEDMCQFSQIASAKSKFDEELSKQWLGAQEQGLFNYKLKVHSRVTAGEHGFLVQLNYQRRTNRRRPEPFQWVKTNFDATKFNFTKIKPQEFLLQIHKTDGETNTTDYNNNISTTNARNHSNYICINASPMSLNHCLIMPQLFSCRPQWLELSDIKLSIELLSLSVDPTLCIAYSVTCAGASINHLHLHCYSPPFPHHDVRLAIQKSIVHRKHVAKGCYIATALPIPPFVFEVSNASEFHKISNQISTVVSYFLDQNIPHNMAVVKAHSTDFDDLMTRVLVWPRKPIIGAKSDNDVTVSVCELMGHILVPSEELFECITEEDIVSFLHKYRFSEEEYQVILEEISLLL